MKKPIFKKWWFWLIVGLLALGSKNIILTILIVLIVLLIDKKKIKQNDLNIKNNNQNIVIGNTDSSNINRTMQTNSNLIETYVAGTAYQNINVNKVFKLMLELSEPYDGYTNKDIKENFENYGESDRYYELTNDNFEYVKLEKEPNNKFDKNAIKVLYDELLLGYVPKEKNQQVLKKWENIDEVRIYPKGGKYKYADLDDDSSKTVVKTDSTEKSFKLEIYFKN